VLARTAVDWAAARAAAARAAAATAASPTAAAWVAARAAARVARTSGAELPSMHQLKVAEATVVAVAEARELRISTTIFRSPPTLDNVQRGRSKNPLDFEHLYQTSFGSLPLSATSLARSSQHLGG
jgi:hypothetical protein